MKNLRPLLVVCIFSCVALVTLPGCSSRKTTTTTTETTETPRNYNDGSVSPAETKTTTTVENEKSERNHGLFGILGDIIALPFRAVGALFETIF